MEYTFEIGNVVGISTSQIFEEIDEVMKRLKYSLRPQIYGVVETINDDGEYGITWAIGGLLDMGKEMKNKLNEKAYKEKDLILIIVNNNGDSGDNMYVNNFFTFDNDMKQWAIYDWSMSCENCYDLPKGYKGCQRENNGIQMSMGQLYLDLTAPYNDGLTNKFKAEMCCEWYMTVKKGTRKQRIGPCVDWEIRNIFRDISGNMFKNVELRKKTICVFIRLICNKNGMKDSAAMT